MHELVLVIRNEYHDLYQILFIILTHHKFRSKLILKKIGLVAWVSMPSIPSLVVVSPNELATYGVDHCNPDDHTTKHLLYSHLFHMYPSFLIPFKHLKIKIKLVILIKRYNINT